MRFFFIFLIFIMSLINYDHIEASANILLWIYMSFLVYNIIKDRYISLASIFIFGFIYIYIREFLNDTPDLTVAWGKENVSVAYYTIVFSTLTLLSGYYIYELLNADTYTLKKNNAELFFIKNRKKFFQFTIFCTYLIFFGNIVLIYKGFTEGRQNSFEYGIFSSISYAIGVICIVNYHHYFKQFYGKPHYLKVFIYSIPIFILYLGSGTRFLLLFGLLAFINNALFNLNFKKIFYLGFAIIAIGFVANFLLQYRNVGLTSDIKFENYVKEKNLSINKKIVKNFTEEGVFRNAIMINDYTQKKGFTNGNSISFILFFWVPRDLWKTKPTMLDFWLIREYTHEFDDTGHSTASGFIGEIFMDFGKYLTVAICLFFGVILSRLNLKLLKLSVNSYFSLIISSSVIAWLFFSVRSVLTSSMLFVFIITMAYIFNKILKKWNIIK